MGKFSAKIRSQPQQARAKAKVKLILDATSGLVAKNSVSIVTTTAIANAAGVSVGSVYKYFTDKTDILEQLYAVAYQEVEHTLKQALKNVTPSDGLEAINQTLLKHFWQVARSHPTFRELTRWANRTHSLVEVTPDADSRLGELVMQALMLAGINIPAARKEVMLKTIVTVISVMVDVAIEEKDETKAAQLIDELATVLTRYLG